MKLLTILLFSMIALTISVNSSVHAEPLWSRTYGGGVADHGNAVAATSDGGFVVAGFTDSFGAGSEDAWIMKFDSSSALQWQKSYGMSLSEIAEGITQTADGGYFVAGTSGEGVGFGNYWALKLDSAGAIEWQKSYGLASGVDLRAGVPTTDGGYILAGSTNAANNDAWVVKLNSSGNIQWQKTYGGANTEIFYTIQQTPDGGYIAAGLTGNFNTAAIDIWAVKLDASGSVVWQKSYGTAAVSEQAHSVYPTADGGYIIGGSNAIASSFYVYLLKVDASGNIQWQKSYGGGSHETLSSLRKTSDGGFIVAGDTDSFGSGASDGWIIKLDSVGNFEWQNSYGGNGDDYLLDIAQTASGFVATGYTFSFGAGGSDLFHLKLSGSGQIAVNCDFTTTSFASILIPTLTVTTTAFATSTTNATITTTTAVATNIISNVAEQCSGESCLFCDDFEDGTLDTGWSYLKPGWNESGGSLNSELTKKAIAIASPFAGCSDCSFESDIAITGGKGKVSMFAWYTDSKNNVEIQINEKSDKFILKQRAPGKSGKTKALFTISPNVSYNVKATYDGTSFSLIVNGNTIATLAAKAPPNGTIGFQTKKTIAAIGQVFVE